MASENPDRQLFLSCVSKEFGAHRKLLKEDLSLPGVWVREQADFVQGGGSLLEKLDAYIRGCDAVIHLIGAQTGYAAKAAEVQWLLQRYPDFLARYPFLAEELNSPEPSLSYTQWEAWLALYHGCRCHIYRPRQFEAQPLPADHPQERHWDRLSTLGKDRGSFDDEQHLCRRVLRDLHDLWPREFPAPPCRLAYPALGELFIGREDFLADVRRRFDQARKAGRWPIHGVHGLGGVGKTRLAVEYAWRYRDHYAAVLMVNAESPESLDRELAELTSVLLSDVDPQLSQPERVKATLQWLDRHPGWLLLVDNVDTEKSRDAVAGRLTAWAKGHVLITSRVASWPREVELLDLHVLADEDAVQFLLQATEGRRQAQPDDAAQARGLAGEDLGGLCLALEQAAAYIGERQISFAEYRKRWAANARNVRSWADKLLMRYHEEKDRSLSVATTWQTTFDILKPGARALLEMLSWLAPDPIPQGLLAAPETESQLRALSGDPQADVETALAELRRYSLLSRSDESRLEAAGQVHRLVQLITRDRLTDEARRRALTAMLTVLDDYAPTDADDVRTWPVLEPLRPHLAAAIQHAEEAGIAIPTTRLQTLLGQLLRAKALYREAEPLYRRALAIDEKSYGPEHPNVSRALNNLAVLLEATNRPAEAEPLMRRALVIDEKSYGPEHAEVATDLNNLALLLHATNRLAEAEPLMRRVVAIYGQSLGEDHPNVATALNNLAQLLAETNRLAEAEPLMRRALAIDETSYGPEHPNVAIRLNNLAQLLQATNRPAEAEPLMHRALAIDEASYGPEHPNVATDLNNLAQLLYATNRLAQAEPLMRRALAIDENSYGPEHPNVAVRLNNLARLLQATNRLAEAEPLMRRSIAIFYQFGRATSHEHPRTQIAVRNYRALLEAMQLDEAEIAERLRTAGA
jgi:tetratricopeptide (TPR) repeat protein